jgi:subtilisin family serine protease
LRLRAFIAALLPGPLESSRCRYADGRDDAGGHGTHTTGIAAGAPAGALQHGGVAHDARLAFFDLGHSDGDMAITAPYDLYGGCAASLRAVWLWRLRVLCRAHA